MSICHLPFATRRRGSTLLLSLLVLSIMLVITASLGTLAVIESQLTRNNSETIVATYVAESGLEQAAYRVRIGGATPGAIPLTNAYSGAGEPAWTRTVASVQSAVVFRPLIKNLTKAFDLYNPDSGNGSPGKASVKLTITPACDGSEYIELGAVPYIPGSLLDNFSKIRFNCTPPAIPGNPSVVIDNAISSTNAYRFYIRYIKGNSASLGQVAVTSCSAANGNGTCDMTGVINLTATGKYRGATRAMNLVIPRLPPITGIFDYGVFSECDIVKDPTKPNPNCVAPY